MRKIILYIAASIDNYIATAEGNIDFLHSPEFVDQGEDYGYERFHSTTDTTLMGNETYKQIKELNPFPLSHMENYVFSTSKSGKDDHVEFVNSDINDFVKKLKQKEGKNIWLIGGGEINSYFINHHLVDEFILTVFPLILGNGIPLFSDDYKEHHFSLKEVKQFNKGVIQLHYSFKASDQ